MLEVIISEEAAADLERIGDYIARDNPHRAETFVGELESRCAGLADFPERFAAVVRHDARSIRRCPHGAYLIFYRVTSDRVDVIRILNAAQDYENILFPKKP